MPRKRTTRVYERSGRYWGDFRDYSDVGGKLEALTPAGERYATKDQDVANELATARVREYERRRRNRALLGVERQSTLHDYARHHLVEKAKGLAEGRISESWMEQAERHLRSAVDFFGPSRDPAGITAREVQDWLAALRDRPRPLADGRTGNRKAPNGLGPGTRRQYLNSLSNLYRRAQSEGCVPPGYNPAAALMEKPSSRRHEARWLEVHDAALLLESARTYEPKRNDGISCIHPLLGTYLLTGGRDAEVRGLAIDDISFDRKTVTFRPHPWRRLKTRTSLRVVPLWPQLEEILRAYVFGGDGPPGVLLFPSARVEGEQPVGDIRKTLDAVAARAGWKSGEIRSKMFRHTYCAARLQTLDGGHPVSPYTVGRELGHGGTDLVEQVYSHLGNVRHRSEAVEYRVEQHPEALGDRLAALRGEA